MPVEEATVPDAPVPRGNPVTGEKIPQSSRRARILRDFHLTILAQLRDQLGEVGLTPELEQAQVKLEETMSWIRHHLAHNEV